MTPTRHPVLHLRCLCLAAALLLGCNAASTSSGDDQDAVVVETGTDTGVGTDGELDLPPTPDAGDDTDRGGDCDPFSDDDECGCAEGVIVSCFDGPPDAAGRGACVAGYRECVGGTFGDCERQVLPADEICDGVDDDCDGLVDEGLVNACGTCGATPEEVCGDGLDNDCDGIADEADAGCSCDDRTNQPCYWGPPGTGGIAACRGGVASCVDGAWQACEGQVLPSPETCNGVDDDCDGLVDEGLVNACGTCGPVPEEICNRVDDDCDGLVDEGVRLPCGACADSVPSEETCGDGFDNDCDGLVDEGCACVGEASCYPGDPTLAGIGACTTGSRTCDPSGEFWGACAGYRLPRVEVCDGIDNDCDGAVDIDTRGCSVCGLAEEVCDGIDNDCDGAVDEGLRNGCGQCFADVTPEELGGPALCNFVDDDCDGMVDEGLVNACGACDDSCYVASETPDESDAFDDGAELIPGDAAGNPTGRPGVTLSSRTFIPPYLWAANHENHTVSKVHVEAHEEQGRYWVGANPSRTAVDLDGNMWVGGRDDGRLTKVLWDPATCPDRNGNGRLDTSTVGALGPINSAADPLADECVVFSAVINPERTSIRGIAAGPDGRVWVGYTGGGIQWIDPNTFELGPFVEATGAPVFRPGPDGVYTRSMIDGVQETGSTGGVYGLVVDSRGRLYISSYNRDTLARFDTATGRWDALFTNYPCGTYGIAIDARNRVWTGGWPNCRGVGMFDPVTSRAHTFAVPAGVTPTHGLEATVATTATGCGTPNLCVTGLGTEPATGNIWASFYAAGYTGRLIVDDANLPNSRWRFIGTSRDDAGNLLPGVSNDFRGIGFDRNGFAWTLGLGSDRVWKIDPATERRAEDLPQGASVGVGTHYTYSDFTGSTALTFTAPRAVWTYVFSAGYPNARVDRIEWEAYVPVGTGAGIRVRVVDGDGLPLGDWFPADGYAPYPLGDAFGTLDLRPANLVGSRFQVEVMMSTSDVDVRPIVHQVDMYWQRP